MDKISLLFLPKIILTQLLNEKINNKNQIRLALVRWEWKKRGYPMSINESHIKGKKAKKSWRSRNKTILLNFFVLAFVFFSAPLYNRNVKSMKPETQLEWYKHHLDISCFNIYLWKTVLSFIEVSLLSALPLH